MLGNNKINKEVSKSSFAEAEEIEVTYYAKISWQESVSAVEEMRKRIWNKEYHKGIEKIIKKASLKEDRDDIE